MKIAGRSGRRGGALFTLLALALAPGCRERAAEPPASVVIAVPYELDTIDPHAEDRLSSFAILFNVYEALVDTDAEMSIRPGLAVAWESPDPATWIFRIRSGVTFHDGRRLRAADVAYSLNRVRRGEGLQVANFARDLAEVEAVDDVRVRIRTWSPSRVLLGKLRHIAIVPEGSTAETLRRAPNGTGPYALVEWRAGESVSLRRHAAYWGRAPVVAEVRFVLGRKPDEALAGLAGGRYQLVKCESRDAAQRPGRVVLEREGLFVKYLAFDLAREVTPHCSVRPNPFRDVRVRRAVSLAIDRRRLVSRLMSDAVPATQPVPRSVFGFDPALPEPAFDRGAALKLMREAGLSGGFGVVLHARPFGREAAAAVRDDLRQIGIRADVRPVTDAAHFELLAQKALTFWLTRIGCASGDASELFEDLIHTRDAAGRFGSLNDGEYANASLDAAIERSVAIEAPRERLDAFQAVMRSIIADHVVVPLYNDRDVYALVPPLSWRPRADSEIRAADLVLKP